MRTVLWVCVTCLFAWVASADERLRCRAEATQRCAAVEDGEARSRCIVEREMECELEGPRRPTRAPGMVPRTFRGACLADFVRLCEAVGPDGSREEILSCLEENRASLSEACREAIDDGA